MTCNSVTEPCVAHRPKSEKLYASACAVIPGGVNSPVRAFHHVGCLPLIVASGKGDLITDVDGNSYIDYVGSWGALILGHAPGPVLSAVTDQLQLGTSYGATAPIEVQFAERLLRHLPHVDKIRFVSSGTEAVMSAVRLAKGFTKRSKIVKFEGNYHGHSDTLMLGPLVLPYNDIPACLEFFRSNPDTAAVVIEPIAGNMGVVPAAPEFLQMLRAETKRIGALLIFDEVISGFRVGLQGAQGLYGIAPDLSCFGKIIGGGFPAAAFGGKKEIMECLAPLGPVFQAGTLSGNPVAMRAGYATLLEIESKGFYEDVQEKTDLLVKPIQDEIARRNLPACLQAVGSMFTLFFGPRRVTKKTQLDEARYQDFFQYLFARGVLFPPCAYEAAFISSAHTKEHLEKTRDLILEYLDDCKV